MTAEYPQHSLTPGVRPLVEELAAAVRGVPAVEDLAPTLAGQVLQLGGKLVGQRSPPVGQGLEVHLEGSTAIVTVDITAAAWRSAMATAEQVQQVVRGVLATRGLSCTSVTVSVLALHL